MTDPATDPDRSVIEATRAARADTAAWRERARLARERAEILLARNRELLEAHVQLYADCAFFMQSVVDGRYATAYWRDGAAATSNLRARADIVVGLDDVFSEPGLPHRVRAGFDDPLAAVLTFIRASDQVNRLVWLSSLDVRPDNRAASGL